MSYCSYWFVVLCSKLGRVCEAEIEVAVFLMIQQMAEETHISHAAVGASDGTTVQMLRLHFQLLLN